MEAVVKRRAISGPLFFGRLGEEMLRQALIFAPWGFGRYVAGDQAID
jgi:hypothetical protein